MGSPHGRFIWHELSTTDVDAAVRFYEDVIGWGTEVYEGAGMPYVIWTADGKGVGGVAASSEEDRRSGVPPHWTGYVYVDDVDALSRKAEALGGKVLMPPSDIPTVGRISVIADPGGAALAVMKPLGEDTPEPAEPPLRHFAWNELMAADREQAFAFYSQLFGWQQIEAMDSPMGTYQIYGRSGRMLGGMMTVPCDEQNVPPHWLYYVYVPDLDDALVRVATGGGRVLHGPMPVPGESRVAQCIDPQGAAFALNGK